MIYQGFNVLKRSIGEVIDEMVELESSMVQIDRVLNESSLNIDNLSTRDILSKAIILRYIIDDGTIYQKITYFALFC